ncbi:F-box only protein 6-like [Bidens hawaiensis]|uniref:F-box only protein 6-like n=1 Tax=Bidens hawaiensis TaxID=980011 RepID=UPI00404AE2BB
MFRQLIHQLQELVDLHGFPPPITTTTVLPSLTPPLHHHDRWCFMNLENSFCENDCEKIIMKATRSQKTKKNRKQTESSKSLKEEIWRNFPEELHEIVLARLPLPSFFRFRSVCQNWNSLLNSNTFTLQYAQFMPPQPWFYIMHHQNGNTGAMYDPVSTKWYYIKIPKLLPARIKMSVFPDASAGGLLCFNDNQSKNFYICNPLTNSFKELPARPKKFEAQPAAAMMLNKKSNNGGYGYQIMLVTTDGKYEVYDSIINKWACLGSMPDCISVPVTLGSVRRFKTVAANGLIYFLRSDPYGIVSYDMESRVWKQYLVPQPPLSRDLALVECGGRIMMVGLVTKSAASCVSVWELQKMTLLWKEVDRMPNVMSLEFYGKHVTMSCLGNSGFIMLCLEYGTKRRLVTYDILKKEWLKVPNCERMGVVVIGTAFHPSLTEVA